MPTSRPSTMRDGLIDMLLLSESQRYSYSYEYADLPMQMTQNKCRSWRKMT